MKKKTYKVYYEGLMLYGEANSPYHAAKKAIRVICERLNTTKAPHLNQIIVQQVQPDKPDTAYE